MKHKPPQNNKLMWSTGVVRCMLFSHTRVMHLLFQTRGDGFTYTNNESAPGYQSKKDSTFSNDADSTSSSNGNSKYLKIEYNQYNGSGGHKHESSYHKFSYGERDVDNCPPGCRFIISTQMQYPIRLPIMVDCCSVIVHNRVNMDRPNG